MNILKSRRINEREFQPGEFRLGLPAIPGDTRLVVNNRQALPRQAIEQCGFTDIGAADNGHFQWHLVFLPYRKQRAVIGKQDEPSIIRDRLNEKACICAEAPGSDQLLLFDEFAGLR